MNILYAWGVFDNRGMIPRYDGLRNRKGFPSSRSPLRRFLLFPFEGLLSSEVPTPPFPSTHRMCPNPCYPPLTPTR
jgi:hypothetical protein